MFLQSLLNGFRSNVQCVWGASPGMGWQLVEEGQVHSGGGGIRGIVSKGFCLVTGMVQSWGQQQGAPVHRRCQTFQSLEIQAGCGGFRSSLSVGVAYR